MAAVLTAPWWLPLEVITADDLIRSGACRDGVTDAMAAWPGRCPAAVTVTDALAVARGDRGHWVTAAANLDGAGYGYGDGYGYGYGDGYGNGYGDGDGDGYGNGDGYGYGYGDGDGYGYGCGDGYGYGCGYGNGDGYGYGYGYGYGEGDE